MTVSDTGPAMDLFSIASWSYAPSNLRHLRPPVPNDLPPHQDATIFTFEDALEDLLAVSQGGAIPDINVRCSQRSLLQQMYPNGEPVWFYLRRLHSQGLIKEPRGMSYQMLDADDDFGSFGRQIIDQAFSRLQWPDWESSQDPFGRRASERRQRNRAADEQPSVADLIDELHKSIHGAFHAPPKDNPPVGHSSGLDGEDLPRDGHRPQRGLLPDTFDDLFSAISSGFAEGHKTWDTFVKTITEHKALPAPAGEDEALQKTRLDKQGQQGGKREVVTQDEHVDRFGYLHTTVTRKTYDEDGNEVGSSTHFTMRPAEKDASESKELQARPDPDAHAIDRNEQDGQDQEKQEKKQGWFWK